ncbi:hypothetical protein ACFQZ4_24095 [Catellatospora coxensis]|uniref:Uncharacterized protein n=1 Tax=Catellatospora coxensis TaxID=310354 RepID=A0A8J3L1P9_9ACTN|nr:hypothetical protein [Catellatospora coxensis]GIG10198.1 hypothetical protein Cco03nite_68980 [Catellatospora coxensis]
MPKADQVRSFAHRIIGCDWGQKIWTAADSSLCHERAVQRVALHDNGEKRLVQLCQAHNDVVIRETDPHDEPEGAAL